MSVPCPESYPATHGTMAPFACMGELQLHFERSPFKASVWLVVQRCSFCGVRVHVAAVLPEPTLVPEDDGA